MVSSAVEVLDRSRVSVGVGPVVPTVDPADIGGLATTLPSPVGRLLHSGHEDRPNLPRDVVEVCANAGAAGPDHSAFVQ